MGIARKWAAAGLMLVVSTLAACTGAASSPAPAASSAPPASSSSAAPASPGDSAGIDESEKKGIAFLGFAKAAGFSNAAFEYVKAYAEAHNAEATFFDGAFDYSGATQARQVQDAITSGKYQVIIIQANEPTSLTPPIEEAVAAGLSVVAAYSTIGTQFDTKEPQIPGTLAVVDVATEAGADLATLAQGACDKLGKTSCNIAYVAGNAATPYDTARTKAATDPLKAAGHTVWDNYEGGYTTDGGRRVGQDILQAHPDVDVIVGASSQAILGVEQTLPEDKKGHIQLIGLGGSEQAVQAVNEGRWYATYFIPFKELNELAAEIGLAKARGAELDQVGYSLQDLGVPTVGTKENLVGLVGGYKDE